GPRWALDGGLLPPSFTLDVLLQLPKASVAGFLRAFPKGAPAAGHKLLAPVEPTQEVWAAGVTYLRSRDAREEESQVKDVYTRVYEAKRPELFFKAAGWRVVGHDAPIRVRADSAWNVPEPELAIVINSAGEIVGHTACNDVSSRDIEGDNPLYLPQAKVYNGSCAVGPGIHVGDTDRLKDLTIALEITRAGRTAFTGETRTSQIKRPLDELAGYLFMELDFPKGTFLSTGTGIVPGQDFSLSPGDVVAITVGGMTLENPVAGKAK
ncbi:MAG TPA: fumarylacetoacetate hydrolase family protein, partial [Polyangia bacterium]|nr:fumarylacetoacetate hydrolase family protein [Polyangia bacterium]